MNLRNLDYECYLDAIKKQREHQDDWLKTGYAPRGYYLKDFCLLQAQDDFHLFHIAGTLGVSCCLPGNEIWLGHATTKNFQTWETHQPCFYIQPGSWDEGHVFAPFVLEKDDRYWMFYTGCAIDNTQRIGLATSNDLFEWHRLGNRPIIRPDEYDWAFCPTSKGSACRDPHVCRWGDEYSLYYTAVTKAGKGCVARAVSKDLINWEDAGVAYSFSQINHCESSNVQKINNEYYLFFGGHHEYWSYVISDNPFHWPEQEPIQLKKGITAMEVVRKIDSLWLVAYFKFDCYRMFLGVIDWADRKPEIHEIKTAAELAPFKFETQEFLP